MFVSHASPNWNRTSLALLLSAALSAGASAQQWREDADATLRADCRLAVQTLQKGHPAPRSDWALSVIYQCNESGGAVLGGLWSVAPSDSVALEELVRASSLLLDRRVYAGVFGTARDAGTARVVRLAALRVLCTYISPGTVIAPDALAKPHPDTAVVPLFGEVSHELHQNRGAEPLPPGVRNEIRDLLAVLWRSDTDPIVRRAGRSLSKRFF